MPSFTKLTAIVDVSDAERCTYVGVSGYRRADERCKQVAYHLIPQSGHCAKHLTDTEIATVLPRIRAWRIGLEDLYMAVSTMTAVSLPNIRVTVEVTQP